ncbi:MAG: SUMF1/EgtB/PvdO family nonheme iron enzyme [Deltaproteobacteria bacterium]|nr:SUMF1/EgtB/PvdO family nonheme iron enzyme [Deltaproteobacteria bacterium]
MATLATIACSTPIAPDPDACSVVERTCPMNCGPTGDGDCCESPLVPGGTFFRGYDVAPDGRFADMTHPATISDFRLDKYAVTVGRFRAFVEAGMGTMRCPPAAGAGANEHLPESGWDESWSASLFFDTTSLVHGLTCDSTRATWTDEPGDHENLPINCVSWFTAMAFCIWDGGRLPTAAEWNYAASGGSEQRAYPWSDPPGSLEIDCTQASFARTIGGCAAITPVGSKPAGNGRWGHADMSGNLWEMTLDWAARPSDPYIEPCVDCARLTPVTPTFLLRDVRGGLYSTGANSLRTSEHIGALPTLTEFHYEAGFRCARGAR